MPSERIQRRIETLLDEADQAVAASNWALVEDRCTNVLRIDPENEDALTLLAAAARGSRELSPSLPVDQVPSLPEGEGRGEGQPKVRHRPQGALARAGGSPEPPEGARTASAPAFFAAGRYTVKKFLGEGGKKKVYLAHDSLLDRDVAFALIKTEGLDDVGRDRITREAQAMGRLGAHPHIVSVFDLGEEPAASNEQRASSRPAESGSVSPQGEGQAEGETRAAAGSQAERRGQPYIVTELMEGGDVEGLIEQAPDHRLPLARTLEIGMQICRGLEFAHGHGIVHRDLKPGNVWLTSPPPPLGEGRGEGPVAKLGDFGLAVALDRSRLTQAGMMVGTVAYMPPEQALGGEVTPRSDLYSLGAMLYEMATGRPPFIGDESVAIITQHLNMAPVSPSWHNPALPAALEALIVRLLEKDPAKRPASAGEVREILEAIQATGNRQRAAGGAAAGPLSPAGEGQGEGESRASVDARALVENPMYRRAFVGREAELQRLQHVYDAATSGQGSLAMVVGEPGIGKTSVCEQLATYATIRGGKTLVGHCYEEGSLSLPYLPFVEAMRSYVLAREPEGLRADLGSGAGEVARLVSEVRDRIAGVSRPHPGSLPILGEGERLQEARKLDPEEERWRLLQAVSTFLSNAGQVQPILLILEDLHDADRGTLDLLLHLARNLDGARLLIVGTYRDVEVDRAHPLSATLAELRRSRNFLRVPLRGLTVDEVHRMMNTVRGQEVPWSRAEAVHRQTEGNPLFIQEVLRYLVEEGLVVREGGRYVRTDGSEADAGIPEGLRDVIGKRLSHLSPQSNQALSVAAVIGRDFRLDVLQRVAGLSEEELDAALEEAAGRSLIEQRASLGSLGFRFTHAFFRQTLYEEIFASRRLRLHQQVARALEAVYGRRVEEHAAELAEHYAQSTDPADLEKALHYSELAAQRASSVFAYGEAARHLEQALKVQEVLNPDDKARRCDLLLGLGEALIPAGEPQRVPVDVASVALTLAEQMEDRPRAYRASSLATRALGSSAAGAAIRTPAYGEWAERRSEYAEPGTVEWVRAQATLAISRWGRGRVTEGWETAQRGLGAAHQLGDQALVRAASYPMLVAPALPRFYEERLRLLPELCASLDDASPAEVVSTGFPSLPLMLLGFGERARAESLWDRVARVSEQRQEPSVMIWAMLGGPTLAALDGRLEDALSAGTILLARAEALGSPALGRRFSANSVRTALLYLGRAGTALEALGPGVVSNESGREIPDSESATLSPEAALCLAHLGRRDEAEAALAANFAILEGPTGEQMSTIVLAWLLEAAILLDDPKIASAIHDRLRGSSSLVAVRHGTLGTCVARHLGAASALRGDREEAMQYYEQALEVAGKIRFRPEIALARLGMAELLLGPNDGGGARVGPHALPQGEGKRSRDVALEHLDFAIAEFREMKMQPSLERALRHKDVLKA